MSGLKPSTHGFCFCKIENWDERKTDRDACLCKKMTARIDKSGFATRLAKPGKMRAVNNPAYNGVIRKLFVVVGAAIQYCHGPVHLLHKNKAYHLMRECHFRH